MKFKNDLIDLTINGFGNSIFDYVDTDGKKYKYTPIIATTSYGMKMFFDRWTEVNNET